MEHNLEIIPVINKIDLPSADVELVKEQIEVDLGLDSDHALLCSAKEGIGIEDILEAITEKIPPPGGRDEDPLSALIFDAHYDPFRGTIVSCRLFTGSLKQGDMIRLMSNRARYRVEEVGIFHLDRLPTESISAGEVGYIIAGIKAVSDVSIGDTVTLDTAPASGPLAGFRKAKPVVFSSIYPMSRRLRGSRGFP